MISKYYLLIAKHYFFTKSSAIRKELSGLKKKIINWFLCRDQNTIMQKVDCLAMSIFYTDNSDEKSWFAVLFLCVENTYHSILQDKISV